MHGNDTAVMVLVHPNPNQVTALGARDYLSEAIILRLQRLTFAAERKELMAWTMIDCTDSVFAEYHLELALRLAREGRFYDAEEMMDRVCGGIMNQSSEGHNRIVAAKAEIAAWRKAKLESPEVILITASPCLNPVA